MITSCCGCAKYVEASKKVVVGNLLDPAAIGSESARLLFGIIDGKKERDTMKMIGGELVVRKSCAPPKR